LVPDGTPNLEHFGFGIQSDGQSYMIPETANGVAGGRQTIYTAGLNRYVNNNVRFMFNYLHGDITKQVSATNTGDAGAKCDAVAMRTQIAF
jgi:phosphate-selective porin OprO/OprP